MRPLTDDEQLEVLAHLRYVTQKVRRYCESRDSTNPKEKLTHSYNMAAAVEDAEAFLTALNAERSWKERLANWVHFRRSSSTTRSGIRSTTTSESTKH